MRIFLGIVALLLIAGSFYADYRWRRWVAERRADRQDR
jgi:hypothetical protein